MAQRQFRSDDDAPGWPYKFGDAADGALVISSDTTFAEANAGCSGSVGSPTLSIDSASSFANGDLVLIHQSRGTGVGNWELNKIQSGGGTTTLTLQHNLVNTYTDSGASQAQIVKLRRYSSVTVQAGKTWSAPVWDGNKGGILAFLCKGLTSIAGTIQIGGKGFVGGVSRCANDSSNGNTGEGTAGGIIQSNSPNGNGGAGGGGASNTVGAGGGGSNGTAGATGSGGGQPGGGGNVVGNAGLTLSDFGGGGGGCKTGNGTGGCNGSSTGGTGGGFLLMITKDISISGAIGCNGNQASGVMSENGNVRTHTSAGGAGGSVLIKTQTATLGSNLITATGGPQLGAGGSQPFSGGAGGDGRIHLDYLLSYSGSTSPGIDTRQDLSLVELAGGSFINNLI